MKKLIVVGLLLLAVIALIFWGNRALEKILDAELAQLLTRQLGIPVTLGPTRARVSTLTVHSPTLVMGNPASPALTASDVSISLAWPDLLRGEIRLRSGSGGNLMVKPSLWPSSDGPLPSDYRFLEPYLPDKLSLDSARYVSADDVGYTFVTPVWQRQSPGATLNWQDEQSTGTRVAITASLTSLDDLLHLTKMNLQLQTQPVNSTDKGNNTEQVSIIRAVLDIAPGKSSGYTLSAQLEAAQMSAEITSGNTASWALPDESTTVIKRIDVEKLRALTAAYSSDATGQKPSAQWLDSPVPRLSLIDHRGQVTVDEIRWKDEVGINSTFDFTASPNGIDITDLSSKGPEGLLQGDLRLASSDSGWNLALNAEIQAMEADKSLRAPYLEADWFWREGESKLSGAGNTWGSLLNSLQGDISLGGYHRGAAKTPVKITARLDKRPGEFALDAIDIQIAKGHITGSATLSSDKKPTRLSGKIKAEQIDLDFLATPEEASSHPGIGLPEYLDLLPGVDMDWELEISSLTVSGLDISSTSVNFLRTEQQGLLTANISGADDARLELRLEAKLFPDAPSQVTLGAEITRFNIPKLFGQESVLAESRDSGTIKFTGSGHGVEEVFKSMKGRADLSFDFRPDKNWKRAPIPEEQVKVSGEAVLVIDKQRITGLSIGKLIVDSVLQNITGELSFVDGRKPWLIADLTSDKLDLDSLRELGGQNSSSSGESRSLSSLTKLSESRYSLRAENLLAQEMPLTDVVLEVDTAPGSVIIKQLDFSLHTGRITSRGDMAWRKSKAALSVNAEIKDFSLGKFVKDLPSQANAPLSGTVAIRSTGTSAAELLAGITGDVQLSGKPGGGATADSIAQVDMSARQTANGMQATIRRFLWEDTDLTGSVDYHRTTPPLLEVEISGGSLSLLPWQDAAAATAKSGGSAHKTKTDGGLIGDIVMAPIRMLAGPKEAKPGEKMFSTAPLPVEWMSRYQARIKGKLDKLSSHNVKVGNLSFSADLIDGQLDIQASADAINNGSGSASVSLGVIEDQLSFSMNGTFKNMQGELVKASFPRSGYVNVNSRGNSEAELAANLNGLTYLELGKGPMVYADMMLLTADVATSVLGTLIPGADKRQPQLECGVTMGIFKDGMGVTPYGYAMRTNQANLVGNISLDLKKELIHMNFSSSSREGVGLSIGNVFSNTVEVEGPITDPEVIPNATGLLWRGWAAVMTGGLSVLGESVLKRALASDNPCKLVQEHIRKDICGTTKPGAKSPMVCPSA